MKLLPLFFLLLLPSYLPASTPPVNDDLANAIELTLENNLHIVASANAEAATLETDEPGCGTTKSWWYVFTPARTAHYEIAAFDDNGFGLDPATEEGDLTLGLYTGADYPLTELGCSDDDNEGLDGGELENVLLTEGQTYYIRIGGKGMDTIADIITTVAELDKYWEGSVSNDYEDPENWRSGLPPILGDRVYVMSGTYAPVLGPNVDDTLSLISLEPFSGITIGEGAQLTVDRSSGAVFTAFLANVEIAGRLSLNVPERFALNMTSTQFALTETGEIISFGAGLSFTGGTTLAGSVVISDPVGFGLFCRADSLYGTPTGSIRIEDPVENGLEIWGDLVLDGSASIINPGREGVLVTNDGTFTVGQTGELLIDGAADWGIEYEDTPDTLENSGTIQIENSPLAITGGVFRNAAGVP